MAITTADGLPVRHGRRRGFFARAFSRIADAQMERARAITRSHLLALPDAELRRLGYTREEVSRWPAGALWL